MTSPKMVLISNKKKKNVEIVFLQIRKFCGDILAVALHQMRLITQGQTFMNVEILI